MATKIKTFSERHPLYRCCDCERLTRCTDEWYKDAEFNRVCSTCWDTGTLELEHEDWKYNQMEHPNQADCPECE